MAKIYPMIFQCTDFQSNYVTTGKHTYKSTFEKHLLYTSMVSQMYSVALSNQNAFARLCSII